jgi:hypothetical protein
MNVFFHDHKRYIGNNKISRYESAIKIAGRYHNLYAIEHLDVNSSLFQLELA